MCQSLASEESPGEPPTILRFVFEPTERAEAISFFGLTKVLKVVNELKARGVNDILIAVVDSLKGFPEAITSVFPQTVVQTCIVHLIRNSLAFVSWKDRKAILPSIKAI